MSDERTNPKDVAGRDRAPMELFPDTAIIGGAMAFFEGGLKYGPYNWREKDVRASVYYGAGRRHRAAWYHGEDIDPKSDLPHLWKSIACDAILIDALECNSLVDDRPPPGPVGRMIERAVEQARAIRALVREQEGQ